MKHYKKKFVMETTISGSKLSKVHDTYSVSKTIRAHAQIYLAEKHSSPTEHTVHTNGAHTKIVCCVRISVTVLRPIQCVSVMR